MIDYSFTTKDLEYFLLILVRITMFVYIAPFFGDKSVPQRLKVGLSIFLSIIIYSFIPKQTVSYNTLFGYAAIVLKEAIVGLLIGYAANICNAIIFFAGKLMDMDIGLSMVTLFDPQSNESVGITGTFYSYLVLLTLIVTNMHHYILRTLIDSFTLIPVSKAVLHSESLYSTMMTYMQDYIVIGFRISLPVFAVILMLNVILGILAKAAPQLNMFVIGMQLKILLGLAVLFLTIGLLPSISNFIFLEMKKMMLAIMEGLQ